MDLSVLSAVQLYNATIRPILRGRNRRRRKISCLFYFLMINTVVDIYIARIFNFSRYRQVVQLCSWHKSSTSLSPSLARIRSRCLLLLIPLISTPRANCFSRMMMMGNAHRSGKLCTNRMHTDLRHVQ